MHPEDMVFRMNITKSLPLCFAIAALQACSSSSDMGDIGAVTSAPAQEVPDSSDSDANTDPQISVPGASLPDSDSGTDSDTGSGIDTDSGAGNGDADGVDANANTDDNTTVVSQLVANAGSVACAAPAADFENTMLAVVNQSRGVARMCGDESRDAVGSVIWNNQLAQAAVNHANDMVTHNFFSHDGSDGLGVSHRADAVSYNWRAIGENIAAGQRDIEEVHQGWLDSPGHCLNIMNRLYTEVGAACVTTDTADYGTYWVVVFGDQP